MPLGILCMMTQVEANKLVKKGYEPIDWVTPRMIADFWGVYVTVYRAAVSRGLFDNVQIIKLGNRVYLSKYDALTAWSPVSVSDEDKFEILRSIPDQLQAEKDSGVYTAKKPTDIQPTREELRAEHVSTLKPYEPGTTSIQSLYVPPMPSVEIKHPVQLAKPKEYRKHAERFPARQKFEKDYLEAMADIVTLTDWEHIIVRAVNDAIEGDSKARMWISDYLIGKPITRIASIQQVQNTQMGEDERTQYLQAIFETQASGEDILDVESFSKDRDSVVTDRNDDADTEEIGGWDFGAEHAVASTSEE